MRRCSSLLSLDPLADECRSTIAQNFAADLDSMFGLSDGSSGVENLHKTVSEKYDLYSTNSVSSLSKDAD